MADGLGLRLVQKTLCICFVIVVVVVVSTISLAVLCTVVPFVVVARCAVICLVRLAGRGLLRRRHPLRVGVGNKVDGRGGSGACRSEGLRKSCTELGHPRSEGLIFLFECVNICPHLLGMLGILGLEQTLEAGDLRLGVSEQDRVIHHFVDLDTDHDTFGPVSKLESGDGLLDAVCAGRQRADNGGARVASQAVLQKVGELGVAIWHVLAILVAERLHHVAEGGQGDVDLLELGRALVGHFDAGIPLFRPRQVDKVELGRAKHARLGDGPGCELFGLHTQLQDGVAAGARLIELGGAHGAVSCPAA
mmetsp:Transcript_4949/g.15724  ORF Transcript_4949/g.15724 Transcript_4949/m.15724 type:complete len:306 (+) Transcript_4949:1109-2026(+)